MEYKNGLTERAFVIGKSHNTPIKTINIPRIELQGALLAARMDSTITKELDLMNYIRKVSLRFQTYLAKRVSEIRELTDPYRWRYCPGRINPAENASRELEMSDFLIAG